MRSKAFYYAFVLSLSVHSVHASLPYSIPNLGYKPLFQTDTHTVPSSHLPSASSLSLRSSTGTASGSGSRLTSQTLLGTASSNSSAQLSTTASAPFPTGSNTTSISLGTGRSSTRIQVTSSLSPTSVFATTESAGSNATATSIHNRSSISSSSNIVNITTLTQTASVTLITNNTIVIVTVTPSDGPPLVITKTVTKSLSSSPFQGIPIVTTTSASRSQVIFPSSKLPDFPFSGRPQISPVESSLTNMPSSRPSQGPGPDGKLRVPFPPPSIFDAIIEGIPYQLPNPGQPPIAIMLMDGLLAQLLAKKVVMRGQTLDIPSGLSGAQSISAGGQSITAQPGKSKKPDNGSGDSGDGNGGGGGGGGLLGALTGVVKAAGSAAAAVGGVASGAASFVSGAAGAGGAAAGNLASTFSSAVGGASDVVSTLNGIQQAFPVEELSNAGMDTFSAAQNLGRDASDWLQSVGKTLEGFDSLPPPVQQGVRDNIRDYTKPDGPLEQAAKAMEALSDFPWEDEAPKTQLPSPTATPKPTQSAQATNSASIQSSQATTTSSTRTTSTTTSSSSSSSSAQPSSTERPLPWFFASKPDTPVEKFKSFIQELDNGAGRLELGAYYQSYRTNLTSANRTELKQRYPFLLLAYEDVHDPYMLEISSEEFHAIPKPRKEDIAPVGQSFHLDIPMDKTLVSDPHLLKARKLLPFDKNAPYWKKMISSPFQEDLQRDPLSDPAYVADDSQGKGTTIYVLDDGFDLSYKDLAKKGREVKTFFVRNEDAFPKDFLEEQGQNFNSPNPYIVRARLSGGTGHGTKMAVIAAGKENGIAPNANLFLMKIKGEWNRGPWPRTGEPRPDLNYATQPKAIMAIYEEVRKDVEQRLAKDPDAKSVINLSGGVEYYEPDNTEVNKRAIQRGEEMNEVYKIFIDWCERRKVTFVVAAGNGDRARLHQITPQRLGTAENGVITVGGVKTNGKPLDSHTLAEAGNAGSMSVYAPGEDIIVPGPGIPLNTGTSQATAIVSGLAAYFHALPISNDPAVENPSENMKQFIISHAWTRIPQDQIPQAHEHLKVVYNLAHGDTAHLEKPCFIGSRKRDGLPVSACSRSENSTSSTSAAPSSSSSSLSMSTTASSVTSAQPTPSSQPAIASQPPTSSSSLPSSTDVNLVPTPPATPPSATPPPAEKCRIYVREFDSVDPNIHGNVTWNVGIFPDTGSALRDNNSICHTGKTGDEHIGMDVHCDPIGETLHVQRDQDNVLRFIRGNATWTSADEKCKVVKDWYPSDTSPLNSPERKRETQCSFECKIDWSKPLDYYLDECKGPEGKCQT